VHTRMAYKPGVHSECYRTTVYLDTGLSISILRRPFDAVNHENVNWAAFTSELQSQLRLNCCEERGGIRIGGRKEAVSSLFLRSLLRSPRQLDIVPPDDLGFVDDQTSGERGQNGCQLLHCHTAGPHPTGLDNRQSLSVWQPVAILCVSTS
jgi:hypothetical protein